MSTNTGVAIEPELMLMSTRKDRLENRGLLSAGAVRSRRRRDPRRTADRGAARARPRGRPRHDAVQVVSRRARADARLHVAAARPRGGRRAAGRPRDRDEVPLVRRPPSEQGRLARAPVPPGLRARPHRARPVRRVAGRPRAAAQAPRARPAHPRRGAAALLDLAQRLGAARADARARGRGRAPAAAGALVSQRGVRRLHPLGEQARPREADRPAARGARRASPRWRP